MSVSSAGTFDVVTFVIANGVPAINAHHSTPPGLIGSPSCGQTTITGSSHHRYAKSRLQRLRHNPAPVSSFGASSLELSSFEFLSSRLYFLRFRNTREITVRAPFYSRHSQKRAKSANGIDRGTVETTQVISARKAAPTVTGHQGLTSHTVVKVMTKKNALPTSPPQASLPHRSPFFNLDIGAGITARVPVCRWHRVSWRRPRSG